MLFVVIVIIFTFDLLRFLYYDFAKICYVIFVARFYAIDLCALKHAIVTVRGAVGLILNKVHDNYIMWFE